jgi:predicted RNA-binding protein with PIN domain
MSVQILIVDGHSVIFAWPDLRALHDYKTALARDRLTRILTEYQDLSGTNVVLVFDGRGPMITQENEPAGIQVFYSNTGHTADDIIERLVANTEKFTQSQLPLPIFSNNKPRLLSEGTASALKGFESW